MPTQATVDRHKRRWEAAEAALARVAEQRDDLQARLTNAELNRDAARAERDELAALDPEARLVADLEAAVIAYENRCREADERRRAGNRNQYATAWPDEPRRREPYRPALESPLGRALLHVAARHGVQVEPVEVYPPPGYEQQLVSVPRHVADQLQTMPMDAFR